MRIGVAREHKRWSKELPGIRKDAAARSRAVIGGQVGEQLAPYFPDFGHNPNEVRFIGKPIDFIVFEGMDDGCVNEIVFIEVKSGNARLSSREREVRDTIKEKRVRWEEYRIR
jgi:predicted Holliday junction resolvase-like endonuclease